MYGITPASAEKKNLLYANLVNENMQACIKIQNQSTCINTDNARVLLGILKYFDIIVFFKWTFNMNM